MFCGSLSGAGSLSGTVGKETGTGCGVNSVWGVGGGGETAVIGRAGDTGRAIDGVGVRGGGEDMSGGGYVWKQKVVVCHVPPHVQSGGPMQLGGLEVHRAVGVHRLGPLAVWPYFRCPWSVVQ